MIKAFISGGKCSTPRTAYKVCALSGLRQFLATKSPLKMMGMAFYFTFKSPFVLKIIKFLTSHFCHVHSISPHFFAGGDNLQCQILKRRGSGKKSVWRVLKSLCHRYLPGRGGAGLTIFLVKKDFRK